MKKFAALLIVLMMLTGFMTATAEMVFATGNMFLRQGPGENYSAIATVYSGSSMQYAGQTTYDANGVAWYQVIYMGTYGWVSDAYSDMESSATSEEVPGTYVRATARVNLRSGPGVGYTDVGTLVEGEKVLYLNTYTYDANNVKWYKIQNYSMGEAWVSSIYAELVYATSAGVPNSAQTGGTAYGSIVRGTGGNSNFRSGPGLYYEDLGTVHRGDEALFLGRTSTDERGVMWYYVQFEGKTGWVSSRYTTLY